MEDYEIEKQPVSLPSDFTLLKDASSPEAMKFLRYAKKRRMTDRQIEIHRVGYCPEGKIKLPNGKKIYLKNRLIIQVHDDNGRSIYWNARAIKDDIQPKSLNPISRRHEFSKSDVLFNLNNAKHFGAVVLTEGIFDAITVGDVGVCGFGKTLSIKQIIQLIKSGIKRVYVMLDPDARKDAVKISFELSKHFEVYICDLKNGDPNEVGRKACLEAIKNAERFTKLTALRYKLA